MASAVPYPYAIMQIWRLIQHDLIPELRQECDALTPKLEKLMHILDWADRGMVGAELARNRPQTA